MSLSAKTSQFAKYIKVIKDIGSNLEKQQLDHLGEMKKMEEETKRFDPPATAPPPSQTAPPFPPRQPSLPKVAAITTTPSSAAWNDNDLLAGGSIDAWEKDFLGADWGSPQAPTPQKTSLTLNGTAATSSYGTPMLGTYSYTPQSTTPALPLQVDDRPKQAPGPMKLGKQQPKNDLLDEFDPFSKW